MKWISLGNPYPHEQPISYDPFVWPIRRTIQLVEPTSQPNQSISAVISSRRTQRSFAQLTIEQLSTLLWLSAKCQQETILVSGFALEWRPVPSAGALHPVHILLASFLDSALWKYDAKNHTLCEIYQSEPILAGLRDHVKDLVSPQQGTILLLVAEPGKTLAKYADGCSLIWRDAGVILGHWSLVAAAMGLNYCPLGITGEPWSDKLDEDGKLVGVGVALVGGR